MLTKAKFVRELNRFIKQNDYTAQDVLVSHGGSMLLMGLREYTNDIDIHVSRDIWVDQILKSKNQPVCIGNGVWLLSVTNHIDIHIGAKKPVHIPVHYNGTFVYNHLAQTLLDYKRLNRCKDVFTIWILNQLVKGS